MDAVLETPPELRDETPAWRLGWLTPARCRIILALVLGFGFFSHLHYVHNDCPIDLSGDEAQYWDWSRQLGLSYYSKGPLVAYVIRASCAIFGETMPAVRYPALVLALGTAVVTYLLVKKLFASERLALGTVLLNHIVPVFIAGSTLMTIDPPYFFCWALATYFAAVAIFDRKPHYWTLVGFAVGVGFLAKYAIFLWFLPVAGFMLFEPEARKNFKSPWLWSGVLIALLFTAPVSLWNAQHDWVSFRHVSRQTGASEGRFQPLRPLEFLGIQIGIVGPMITILLIGALAYVFRRTREDAEQKISAPDRAPMDTDKTGREGISSVPIGAPSGAKPDFETASKLSFLTWIGLSFLLFLLVASFRTKIQPNWPAPAYFTLLIVTAYFIGTRLRSASLWKPWRGWFWAAVVMAVVMTPLLHDPSIAFSTVKRIDGMIRPNAAKPYDPAKLDHVRKLRGWEELGAHVTAQLATLPPGSFVLCHDYQQTAEMSFYVAGRPTAFCAGPYYTLKPSRPSQYDMWPERRLTADNPLVFGRDAIYVGEGETLRPGLPEAFDRVERLPDLPILVRGTEVRRFKLWKCHGFKGMTRHQREGIY